MDFTDQSMSIGVWINIDDNETAQTIISNYNSESDDDRHGYSLGIDSQVRLEFQLKREIVQGPVKVILKFKKIWTHVVVVYSGAIKFYINGQLDDESCNYGDSISSSSDDVLIGAQDSDADGTYSNFFRWDIR